MCCSVHHSPSHRPSIPAQPASAFHTSSLLYSRFRMSVSWLDFFFIFFYLFNDSKCFIFHIRRWIKGITPLISIRYLLWSVRLYNTGRTETQSSPYTLTPALRKQKWGKRGCSLNSSYKKPVYNQHSVESPIYIVDK